MTAHPDVESPLAREFLVDHQALTRGLASLRDAIASTDIPNARLIADRLDRSAGGHMEFEERVLYPRVAQTVGSEYVDRLYAEHRIGRDAVLQILSLRDSEPLPADEQSALLAKLETVGEHVLSCGTLLSHLTALDAQSQQRMLDRLNEYRREGVRWTEMPEAGNSEGALDPTPGAAEPGR